MSLAWTARFAPAKVNLFLHVGPVGADGYHPINSLMVFADVGDSVRLRDAAGMAFHLEGEFADALASDADNLVTRARDRFLAAVATPVSPFELVLEKRLPIAAGLGGGSADAAAALALIAERHPGGLDRRRLADIARGLGADVTACMTSRSVIARGRGDDVSAAPSMPALDAVLVNPLAPSATGAVYRAFDALPPGLGADEAVLPEVLANVHEVVDGLRRTRNDLEAPAVGLQPKIGEVLEVLRRAPEALLGRMSGSGATCFALCADARAAGALAARIAAARPDWWVRACRLGAA